MKKITIHKGFHRPFSFIPACFKGMTTEKKFRIKKKIKFTESCKYNLRNNDQYDWNKLFGVCFGIFGIHKNSARFVWRYVPYFKEVIEIGVYYYKNGKRSAQRVFFAQVGEEREYEIEVFTDTDGTYITFYIDETHLDIEKFEVNSKVTFGCGLYFGGNRRAPQDISIYMENN